jgi:hypothetical protein
MSAANDRPGATPGLHGLELSGLGVVKITQLAAASGKELRDSVGVVLDRILQLERETPWGDDEIGQDFLAKVYHTPVNGTPFHQVLHKALRDVDEAVREFGPRGRSSVQRYTEVDSTDSTAFLPTTRT